MLKDISKELKLKLNNNKNPTRHRACHAVFSNGLSSQVNKVPLDGETSA